MKKTNFYAKAAALLMAGAMVLGLQSCSTEDNPSGKPEEKSTTGKLIFKEINVGGGYKTTEGKSYNWCKGIVLYNNGSTPITVKNLAMGAVPPANAHGIFHTYQDGKLIYEDENWVPVWATIWYIPEITIAPYSDAVIAVNGAIDHTKIAPEAFNLADASYYCMYDPESGMNNANAYPTPYEGIPASNYWKGILYGAGNAWAVSVMCPALILFQIPEGTDIAAFCKDSNNFWYDGSEKKTQLCMKIQKDWIIDGVEFYRTTMANDGSFKRLPAKIDAGFGLYNSNKQYSAYRNVDKAATEAIAENAGKLVYGYNLEQEGTEDTSDIDAAASMKKGAKIVYMDTNNSTADFHVRAGWSLK
ncbi:MAG: DUF4876 domain-containing protein [Prevotella sp.]|nr:DUF4876 domain-containing protein [Prevotella sp.]